ncbi:hypothetical protein ACIOMM_32770 [Streptomyces sp. NPDC087908]|uniref:hypothetical protein n=1 Tax=Streptomyces sp. NPDC087908 TaxID=3365820 RepID=UPI0038020A34
MKTLNPSQKNPRLRYEYDRGSGYEEELRLTTALSALVPADDLVHPDHRLFQVVHLMTEYAWVAIHHTMCDLEAALAKGDLVGAVRLLKRATDLSALPVSCARLLTDSLPQLSFLQMRAAFPANSSGLDSPGARGIRKAGMAVWQAFEGELASHAVTMDDLVPATDPSFSGETRMAQLADLVMQMQRFDTRILEWKQVHLNLVWQLLGGHPCAGDALAGPEERPTSMRGRPISDLERLSARPLFPKLWQHSTSLYQSYGTAPGCSY